MAVVSDALRARGDNPIVYAAEGKAGGLGGVIHVHSAIGSDDLETSPTDCQSGHRL